MRGRCSVSTNSPPVKGEVLARLRQQDRDLERERKIAVQVLMQAIEIAGNILQQERRRALLAGIVAELQEIGMLIGIAGADAHTLVPRIRDGREARIERGAQIVDQIGRG
jgi:hypothetical protein